MNLRELITDYKKSIFESDNSVLTKTPKSGFMSTKKIGYTESDDNVSDDLFWFILDNDRLHKQFVMPLALKIKKRHDRNRLDKTACVREFMPLVEQACIEYYKKKKLNGKISKHFPEDLKKSMCERLFDHYYEDIIGGCYKLGC